MSLIRTLKTEWWSLEEMAAEWHLTLTIKINTKYNLKVSI